MLCWVDSEAENAAESASKINDPRLPCIDNRETRTQTLMFRA